MPERFRVEIITLSDRAYRGEYKDLSGPLASDEVKKAFDAAGWQCEIINTILPDDPIALREALTAQPPAHLIITTGGTGIGSRDVTPEVVQPLLTREIPGVMELIRVKYGMQNPAAALSRGVAGLMGQTLIYTLPGSVKAVKEYMTEITATMEHTFQMIYDVDTHSHK